MFYDNASDNTISIFNVSYLYHLFQSNIHRTNEKFRKVRDSSTSAVANQGVRIEDVPMIKSHSTSTNAVSIATLGTGNEMASNSHGCALSALERSFSGPNPLDSDRKENISKISPPNANSADRVVELMHIKLAQDTLSSNYPLHINNSIISQQSTQTSMTTNVLGVDMEKHKGKTVDTLICPVCSYVEEKGTQAYAMHLATRHHLPFPAIVQLITAATTEAELPSFTATPSNTSVTDTSADTHIISASQARFPHSELTTISKKHDHVSPIGEL